VTSSRFYLNSSSFLY